ncbi:MAG: FMN-binding negative transcriptional regulator [Steroidobacteraceae bacterium]
MYLPKIFEESRLDVLHRLIRTHPFGTLVIASGGELDANHVPFLMVPDAGPFGTLQAHVSRSNPVWEHLDGPLEALAIFQGPDAYVTPSWYPSKRLDGKVVPTWNYAVVHAYGKPRAIEEPAWLEEHVTRLTAQQESRQLHPWQVSDAPAGFVERMISRIVGIEIPVARIHGKWKVNQNRKLADTLGVAAGLQSQATEKSRALAQLVLERAREASSE